MRTKNKKSDYHVTNIFNISRLCENDDTSTFFCTDSDLNDFLHNSALLDIQRGYSVTHLVKIDTTIVGFFTLIADSIQNERVGAGEFPDYCYGKLPAMKIARLATHKEFERRGVGAFMVNEAFKRAYFLTYHVGCCVITVDAKEDAVGFYEKYSFFRAKAKPNQGTVIMYLNFIQFIENTYKKYYK